MKILGITGKIGSGKSTIIDIIKNEYNIYIISLDDIAKKIIFDKNITFDNKNFFLSNENIEFVKKNIHPLVWDNVKNIINEVKKNDRFDFIVIETALPNEIFFEICDYTICVISSKKKIFLKKNRNYSDEKIRLILKEQNKYNIFYQKCDFFINNEFDKKILIKNVLNIINKCYGKNEK